MAERIVITAKEVHLALDGNPIRKPGSHAQSLASDLSDPAIQRLVVTKCVEALDFEKLDALADSLAFADITDGQSILIESLTPTHPASREE